MENQIVNDFTNLIFTQFTFGLEIKEEKQKFENLCGVI